MEVELFSRIKRASQIFSLTGKYLRLAQKPTSDIDVLKSQWSEEILKHLGVELEIIGTPEATSGPLLFVGNHISYLDMPLLLSANSRISFVSKSEVSYWPVIGPAARAANTVFVQRGNTKSRKFTRVQIEKALLEKNRQIAVFPSGTTAMAATRMWRQGIFNIAEKLNVRVQPFRIRYEPLRAIAYIDKDFFPVHIFNLVKFTKLKASLEFHEPVQITDSLLDCHHWQRWCEAAY